MQFFVPIQAQEGSDLERAASAIVNFFDDDVSQEAVLEVLRAGQVVTPAEFILAIQALLAAYDIETAGTPSVACVIPGQTLETALPKTYRPTTVIARLLGEEEGDIPTSAVYDLVDLLNTIEVPESEEEKNLVGEVLARAILGVTSGIPEGIQLPAGLVHYRNAYNGRVAALIDPDAEAAPEEAMTAGE